jgi:hypothetical protein
LDPADGSFNYAAPGANRLNIELALVKKEINSADPIAQVADPNFIQLLKIINGIKYENIKYPLYSALENTLTKKSHNKSGDFTISPFNLRLSPHRGLSGVTANSGLDGTAIFGNNTLFTTELSVGDMIYLGSNGTTSEISSIANNTRLTVLSPLSTSTENLKIYNESEISIGLSSGIAQVNGHEYESVSTQFIDIDKGRDTATDSNYSMGIEMGNYLVVDTANGLFDVGSHEIVHLHSVPYASINVDDNTAYLSTQTGTARIRSMEWDSSSGNTTNPDTNHSNFRVYLWDVDTSNSVSGTVGGAITNTQIIQLDTTSTSYVNDAYTGASITINTTSGIDSTSDIRVIDNYYSNSTGHYVVCNTVLSQATIANSSYEVEFSIKDTESVVVGEYSISLPGANASVSSYVDISSVGKYNNNETGNTILHKADLSSLVYPLPQSPVKETVSVGNTVNYMFKLVQKDIISDSSGKFTITLANPNYEFLPTSGTLSSADAQGNYIVVVKTANGGSATIAQTFVNAVSSVSTLPNASGSIARNLEDGNYLDLNSMNDVGSSIRPVIVSGDKHTLEIYCNTSSAFSADIIYSVQSSTARKEPGPRTKSLISGNGSHVGAYSAGIPTDHLSSGQFYFTSPNHTQTSTDSLFVSDAFNLVKVVDSGQSFIPVTNTMMSSTANDITHMYEFDTGQKDNFYDHSKIKLKPNKPGPSGQIMVVVDYFDWDGALGYHSIDSYPSSGNYNQKDADSVLTFDYTKIPEFTSPITGETLKLRDCVDFRPRRENETNDFQANTAAVESIPTPIPNGTLTADVTYYLPRVDKLTLTKDRKFKVLKGTPTLNPIAAPDDEDSMTLYTLNIPAYTFNLSDIITRYVDNKSFTMRDIGKLEKRIERLEYYTSLSLLEKETAARDFVTEYSKDSLFNEKGNTFKNGILIDSFSGHSVGDVMNDDYNISIEYANKEMRPGFYYDNHVFTYNPAYSNNITKTGDLITLPYTEVDFIQQPLSSNTIVANPFNIVNFVGNLKTLPSSDVWFSQNSRPDILTNLEGQNDNWRLSPGDGRTGFGSQFNDWETNWTGTETTEEPLRGIDVRGKNLEENRSTVELNNSKTRIGILPTPPDAILKIIGKKVIDTTVVPYMRGQVIQFTAKGLRPLTNVYAWFGGTDVSANVRPATILTLATVNSNFQVGETIIDGANNFGTVLLTSNTVSNAATVWVSNVTGNASSTSGSPYGAANNISIGEREIFSDTLGDATHVFASGNNITGETSSATASITLTVKYSLGASNGIMRTDSSGQIAGEVFIDDSVWRTGDNLLRITDNILDNVSSTIAVAETKFSSKGLLDSHKSNYISTREVINRREIANEENIFVDTTMRETEKTNWLNPTTQTFYVDPNIYPKGLFLRNISLYFSAKDLYLPVTVQLRPVENGFPSASKILPFSEVTLNPDSINVNSIANSADSNTSTKFTFDSLVYLTPNEYAIVIDTNSTDYQLHIAEEGYVASGTETTKISKPPFIGAFYRPQNSGIWNTNLDEYLTFRMERANFDIGVGGNTNFAKFINSANSASGNTSDVVVDTFRISTSTIDFSDTETQWKYVASNSTYTMTDILESTAIYTDYTNNQNINLTDQKKLIHTSNGNFRLRAELVSANSHVSPVIDIDRLNITSVENIIDNGELSDSDITIITRGSGYENVESQAVTATLTGGGTTNTATLNVHVSVTMNVISNSTTITSANSSYTVDDSNPGIFVVGEAVMANTVADVNANNSGVFGVIDSITHLEGDVTKNVSSVTIKTNTNNQGSFGNNILIWANPNAQINAATGLQNTASNTKMNVLVSNGYVSNVVIVTTGTGYTQNPTVNISTIAGSGSINASVQCTGEERNSGGPITSKYISRRVTLKDGFDASDLKVVFNAYKPKGTDIHVYYKVKNADDPEDFDLRNYALMTQETSAGTVSRGKEDFLEFIYKTSGNDTSYISNNIRYGTFKTFAVKIAYVANTTYDMPRVKDVRAIALD